MSRGAVSFLLQEMLDFLCFLQWSSPVQIKIQVTTTNIYEIYNYYEIQITLENIDHTFDKIKTEVFQFPLSGSIAQGYAFVNNLNA